MKEIVKNFMNGTNKCFGDERWNVVNGGKAIKVSSCGMYYFYCDSVCQEALEEYCEEHHLGWWMTVVPSRRMNVYGTRERVKVEMWSRPRRTA